MKRPSLTLVILCSISMLSIGAYAHAQPQNSSTSKNRHNNNAVKNRSPAGQDSENVRRLKSIEETLKDLERKFSDNEINSEKQLTDSRAELWNIKAALKDIEPKTTQSELAAKADILKMESDISQSEARISQSEARISQFGLTIGTQTFAIFGVMLGLAGILGAVAIYFIRQSVIPIVLSKAEEYHNEKIKSLRDIMDEHLQYSQRVTIAEMYAQIPFPWWRHYEAQYQELLQGKRKTLEPLALDLLRIAKDFAESGLANLRKWALENDIHKNSKTSFTYAKLLNHLVYHKTAWLTCDPSAQMDNKIISEAMECYRMAKEQKRIWYGMVESAAVTFIRFGDLELRRFGQELMRDLLKEKVLSPNFDPPPKKWLIDLWNDYFPENADGTNKDIWELGSISKPVANPENP